MDFFVTFGLSQANCHLCVRFSHMLCLVDTAFVRLNANSDDFQPYVYLSKLGIYCETQQYFEIQHYLFQCLLYFCIAKPSVTSLVPERTTNCELQTLSFPLALTGKSAMFVFRGFSGSGRTNLLVIENYTILDQRNVRMLQITTLET